MKINAYKTECCHKLKDQHEVHGVLINKDMFDDQLSFVTVSPQDSNIHYCSECYVERVVEATSAIVRRKNNEEKYQLKMKELAYVFKKSLFTSNHMLPSGLAP